MIWKNSSNKKVFWLFIYFYRAWHVFGFTLSKLSNSVSENTIHTILKRIMPPTARNALTGRSADSYSSFVG